ncbi:MAG: DMT family transporter [Bdellovibrionota bacterium]
MASSPDLSIDRPIKALGFMVLAQFLFSTNTFLLRMTERVEQTVTGAAFELSPWEPMFYRSILMSVWCLYLIKKHPGAKPTPKENFWLWARGIVGVLSLTTYYYGVLHIPLGMAALFSNSSPIYVTFLAIIITREVVTKVRLLSVAFGFLGVGLVAWGAIQQTGTYALFDVIIAGVSGPLAALAYFSIRQLKRIKSEQIMLSLGLGGVILSVLAMGILGTNLPQTFSGQLTLIASVIPAVLAQASLTRAFRLAPASQISPLQYTGPVFASMYASLFLDESLPQTALIGVLVVLAFGLFVPYLEALWVYWRDKKAKAVPLVD